MFKKLSGKLHLKRSKDKRNEELLPPASHPNEARSTNRNDVAAPKDFAATVVISPVATVQTPGPISPAPTSNVQLPQQQINDEEITVKPTQQPAGLSESQYQKYPRPVVYKESSCQTSDLDDDITETTVKPVQKPSPEISVDAASKKTARATSEGATQTQLKANASTPVASLSTRSRPYAGFSKAHAKESLGRSDDLNIRSPPTRKPTSTSQANIAAKAPSASAPPAAAAPVPQSGRQTSSQSDAPQKVSSEPKEKQADGRNSGAQAEPNSPPAFGPSPSSISQAKDKKSDGQTEALSGNSSPQPAYGPAPPLASKPEEKKPEGQSASSNVSPPPVFSAAPPPASKSKAKKAEEAKPPSNASPPVFGPAPPSSPQPTKKSEGQTSNPADPPVFGPAPPSAATSQKATPSGASPRSPGVSSTPKPATATSSTQSKTPAQNAEPTPSDSENGENPLGTFRIQVNNTIWPEFAPDSGGMERTGSIFMDFASTLTTKWARGDPIGPNEFGPAARTDKPALGGDLLPLRLYDLVDRKVVLSRGIPANIHYAAISHVWGDKLIELDGSKYGVDWKIPIRSQEKLHMILEAARVITGVEFIWMDVLCLDQRTKNETEISKMKMYYGNAVECLVWLDNAYETDDWNETLSSIEEVNKTYKLDKHGIPAIPVMDMFAPAGSGGEHPTLFNLSMNETEVFTWVTKLTALEKAAWFKRVWTLQEAVIPDKLTFCTPERYMTRGGNLFQIVGLCGQIAKLFMDIGVMTGVAVGHLLQKSECWKILRLRQLYQKKELSYWHVSRAVRSRKSKYEQDRVFGACGMISGPIMVVNYDRSIDGLHQELWKTSVDSGDFAACCFLGGSTFHPHLTDSMGLIIPESGRQAETHTLLANQNSIRMEGVGIDVVRRVHALVTDGSLRPWGRQFPEFMSLSIQDHIDLAVAFETSADTISGGICPGAFAALSFGNPLKEDLLNAFGAEFREKYWAAYPKGMMTWIRSVMLMAKDGSRNYGTVILWTDSSPPQLAMVDSPVTGNVIVVTPSSYVENPGNSCLICQIQANGTIKKIGVGVGSKVKAGTVGSFLLTA